jgi:hypothetical protein
LDHPLRALGGLRDSNVAMGSSHPSNHSRLPATSHFSLITHLQVLDFTLFTPNFMQERTVPPRPPHSKSALKRACRDNGA